MKKRSFIFLILTLILPVCINAQAAPDISASSACLIAASTGRILYEKNAFEQRGMASTTKIMSAIVALEYGDREAIITVSDHAAKTEGSSIWLEAGEKMRLEDLLYGLLLASGNDAAVAIAEGISGSVEEFVKLMNQKAKEIGAANTSFQNPNGLTEENHYTTAYDLALITRYAMQNETFRTIVGTKTKTIPWESSEWDRTLTNHNKLLNYYEGCDGVKTGYTKACGRCLVSTAQRNGMRFICVTLNAPNDWADHQNLLDFAFSNYSNLTVLDEECSFGNFPIADSEQMVEAVTHQGFVAPLLPEEMERVKVEHTVNPLTLPIQAGEEIGTVKITLDEKILAEIPLVAKNSCEKERKSELWAHFNALIKLYLRGMNES